MRIIGRFYMLLMCLSVLPLYAQPLMQDFGVVQWSIREGLPQSSVGDIEQTQDGYLWLATQGGLARFDGVSFTVFNTSNTPALESNRINVLYEDRAGRLWIGTEKGLVCYTDGEFISHTEELGHPVSPMYPHSIAQDAEGRVWIVVGAKDHIVYFYEGAFHAPAFMVDSASAATVKRVTQVFIDNADRLWLRAPQSLLLVKNGTFRAFGREDGLPFLTQKYLHTNRENTLPLIAARNERTPYSRFIRFEDGRFSTAPASRPWMHPNEGYFLDSHGRFWVAGNEGIRVYEEEELVTVLLEDATSTLRVNVFFEDREGNIWAGTDLGGLFRFKSPLFQVYSTSDGLAYKAIRTVESIGDGAVLVNPVCGGPGYDLSIIRDGAAHPFFPEVFHIFKCVNALFGDEDGSVWLGGYDLYHAVRRPGFNLLARHSHLEYL